MFNNKRLKLARQRRSLSKKELSEKLNLSIQTLSDWEMGKVIPKFENIVEVSKELNFPIDFFDTTEDVKFLEPSQVTFRALTKMKASDRDMALACGALAIYFNSWVEKKFNLPTCNIPLYENIEPEEAKKKLKSYWNITEDYIENAIYLLEKNGVRVYSLSEYNEDFDAFSTWEDDTPFVFLNTVKSAERSRFDAMHELGHLVMHKNTFNRDKKIEEDANRFASEMLMPTESIMEYKTVNPSIGNLIQMKQIWLVSLKALIFRLNKLNIITDWTYRLLMMEVSKRGYNKTEPLPMERETSIVLKKVFSMLKEEHITIHDIANELGLSSKEINSMIFNMFDMYVTINGENNSSDRQRSKADLKII